MEVQRWDGVLPFGRQGERSVLALTDLLERCTLFTHEWHWLAMCDISTSKARRKPPRELRRLWVHALQGWLVYLEEHSLFADAPRGPLTSLT